jgi:DNA-binding MarR family transcriptional regulator
MPPKSSRAISENGREDRLGRVLATLYYVARRDYEIDLTHRAIRVLQFVGYREKPPRLDDVANFLNCAPSTASELMKRLQKKELLIRNRSSADERVIEIKLTEFGKTALVEHTSLDPGKLKAGLETLEGPEQEALIRTLDRIVESIDR